MVTPTIKYMAFDGWVVPLVLQGSEGTKMRVQRPNGEEFCVAPDFLRETAEEAELDRRISAIAATTI